MDGLLSSGRALTTRSGEPVEVLELLGAGGQGEVYRVRTPGGDMALKWYLPTSATDEQRTILEKLVSLQVDDERFLWPKDLVFGGHAGEGFGYVMRLRPAEFHGLPDLFRRRVKVSFRALLQTSLSVVEAYRALHSRGIAYRDISWGNVFFDPKGGRALVCDNDNAIFEGEAAGVHGTMVFMAPELVREESRPSTQTDLHSLAVLLFMLLVNQHPLEGARELAIHCMDAQAQRRLYGDEPVFIFDPVDTSNQAVKGEHDGAILRWRLLPERVRDLFVEAFTVGLDNPDARVREGQWRDALGEALDNVVYCPACGRQNLHDERAFRRTRTTGVCWSCRSGLTLPPRVRIDRQVIMLNRDAVILAHHVGHSPHRDDSAVVAAVTEHPSKPGLFGLTNRSDQDWVAHLRDGSEQAIAPGQTVPLKDGLRLELCGAEAEVRASTA